MSHSRAAPLIGFGFTIIICGLIWRFFNDVINTYIARYVLNNKYYVLSDLLWNMLPWIVVIIGIIVLILTGIFYGVTKTVVYE